MRTNNQPGPPKRSPPDERNPETAARFRREAWWQITFPVLAATVISMALVVLVIVLGQQDITSIVADYSLILFIIPNLVVGLILMLLISISISSLTV